MAGSFSDHQRCKWEVLEASQRGEASRLGVPCTDRHQRQGCLTLVGFPYQIPKQNETVDGLPDCKSHDRVIGCSLPSSFTCCRRDVISSSNKLHHNVKVQQQRGITVKRAVKSEDSFPLKFTFVCFTTIRRQLCRVLIVIASL
jgi:hypothetical protein